MPERNFKPSNAVRRLVYPAAFWCVLSVMSALSAPQAQAQSAQLPQCPATLEEARAAKYVKIEDNLYYTPAGKNQFLRCNYFTNGQLEWELLFKFGEPEGIMKRYYENGALQGELPYKAGKIEGTVREYYKNGKLKAECPFKADKADGTEIYYYESGKLWSETQYKANKRDGKEIMYREDGTPVISIIYAEGSPVSGLCHQSDGETVPLTNAELSNWKNGLDVECR